MAAPSRELAAVPFEEWPEVLTPGEVGLLFRVDPRTVRTWSTDGKLKCIRTAGNHRRYAKQDVWDLFNREE